MLEDTRLKIFMAVADEGSFTRAAYLMGITQPAVSQNIAELERETGRILFERGKGVVTLTPDGERFRVHADRILREHAALDTAFSVASLPAVSIAATPYLLHSYIPSLLDRLASRLPMRITVRTLPEGMQDPGDADLSFYSAPYRDALDFGSVSVEPVRSVCLTAEPDLSLSSGASPENGRNGSSAAIHSGYVRFPDTSPTFFLTGTRNPLPDKRKVRPDGARRTHQKPSYGIIYFIRCLSRKFSRLSKKSCRQYSILSFPNSLVVNPHPWPPVGQICISAGT